MILDDRLVVIGITGQIGAGKTLAASMVPDAVVVPFAEPLYRMLSAMTGIPVADLQRRDLKERPIPWLGRSPRELLQTLGTDWGRDRVSPTVWIDLWRRRVAEISEQGVRTVVAPDLRFDNEALAVRSLGGEIWKVVRTGAAAAIPSHKSEHGIPAGMVDRLVLNAGTADDLRHAVLRAAGEVRCSTASS